MVVSAGQQSSLPKARTCSQKRRRAERRQSSLTQAPPEQCSHRPTEASTPLNLDSWALRILLIFAFYSLKFDQDILAIGR